MTQQDRLGPQLPLALRYPPEQRFEAWVGAPLALARLQAFANGESLDALYLQGGNGSGKTHLLLAACAAAEAAGRRANYLSLARAHGHARDALQGVEQTDLVALDDLDAIAGHREDEVALFDLHNRVRDAGVGLVYAARDVPAALPLVLPDLRSRLAQCSLVALRALDDDGRAEVLRQRAASRGLVFDEAALEWLLRRHSRDLSDLGALFERLDRASLAAQRRLTVPFLRQVLGAD
ncbi:DnaA regulatory inactivator Hda [Thermomonas sp. HDW16]|uniref:DnaA regulatory inactivator Hda n=1 Tax=Thermomonas sp. HDW16 TaxID=2714945 RepID=UPI00140769D4|nr:DnaA regulatory inactivator Hda [Thermomonas sp. HDW16]QIL20042.1 DnaA regulatory inactivator Hda [Thermomonas sp. HDW16]